MTADQYFLVEKGQGKEQLLIHSIMEGDVIRIFGSAQEENLICFMYSLYDYSKMINETLTYISCLVKNVQKLHTSFTDT